MKFFFFFKCPAGTPSTWPSPQRSTQIKLLSGQLGVCVCYLLAPWGAGVGWRCAGNIQRAGATAGWGGASNPDREKQITAVFLNQI